MRFEIEVILEDTVYEYTLALEFPDKSKELQVLEEKLTVAGKPVYTSGAVSGADYDGSR